MPSLGALGLLLVYSGVTEHPRRSELSFLRAWERLSVEAGTRWSAARLLFLCLSLFAASFIAVAGLTSALVPSVVIGAAAFWTPIAILRGRRVRRRSAFRAQWPDAISTVIAGVRAGVSLSETCCSLAERGPNDLRPGFRAFAATFRSSGSFQAGVASLRRVLADPITDRVAVALSVAHEVGGSDLVRVLRTLADFVREDLRVRNEIQARWSWTVTAARVAAVSPWIVLLIMSLRPEAAAAYNTASGGAVIVVGVFATILGYRLMLRAARLPEERRLEP